MNLTSIRALQGHKLPAFYLALVWVMLAFGLSLTPTAVNFANDDDRPLGDSRVFSTVPAPPGYPEGIAVNKDLVYVSGPAVFGNFQPSKVLVYDLDSGALVQEIAIQGQNFTQPHALSAIAFDRDDRLYALDLQQGVIRFPVDNPSAQTVYAPPLPDLAPCSSVPAGTPCSPTLIDRPPLPNDPVFDKDGNLYVSDSFQATIWRIPPGGGQPQIWFQDSRLDADFGPNGMRLDRKGEKLFLVVTFDAMGHGFIYTLPVVDQPAAADLTLFHEYTSFEGPDGIAFGKSGKLYVALAASSQISVLGEDGTEEARYSGPASHPADPSGPAIPWANPANIAFNDKAGSLLVTNHASLVPDPTGLFIVFDVFVDDRAQDLERPNLP
jgi:sugar lactone lactonase YvrE